MYAKVRKDEHLAVQKKCMNQGSMDDHTEDKVPPFICRRTLHSMEICLLWAPELGFQITDPMGRNPWDSGCMQ